VTPQRHPNCTDTECDVCLNDVLRLRDELLHRIGWEKDFIDVLGHYRGWLERQGFVAETEHGWATPQVFDESNVEAYVAHWHETGEDE